MSLWSSVLLIFKSRTNAVLERAEDPREMLDYGFAQQQELLRKVKQGLIEVATSKAQLQQQVKKLHSQVSKLEDQARRAVAADRADLARVALERKQTALAELTGLERQVSEVAEEEQNLARAEKQLSTRIEEFRTRREVLSARYTAAEAKIRVSESLSGVSGELADLYWAMGRAEEKTERLQARASAIGSLIENGTLAAPGGNGDPVEQELRKIASNQAVEAELAALLAQVGQAQPPPTPDSNQDSTKGEDQ
jgi:phage shock protein A